jgi:hypothetical protein
MTRSEYLRRAEDAYYEGKISEEVYEGMVESADIFCDDEEDDEWGLPRTYAEIEYDDMDTAEAQLGSRFDDINFLRYMER